MPETMSVEKRSNLLLLLVLQVAWLNVCVQSRVVSLNCTTFCPEVPAIYHCVITSVLAQWELTGSITDDTSYNAADPIGRIRLVGSFFTANKTGNTSFNLNFIAEAQFNNSVNVTCIDAADANINTNSRQCTIKLEGPPTTSPSLLSYTAINSTSVNISWSPSSEQCLDYYRVTVANQQEIFNTTSTSLTISNRLEGVQYSYTVAVVDGANRSGPQSNSGCFNLDTPEQVPGLTAIATGFPENLTQVNATANISVQWMQPTLSCPRPDVIQYRIGHNVTNNDINITVIVPTPTTTTTITGATLGSIYTIQIQASNILGYGPATVTTIFIPTSSPPPEPTSSSSTLVVPTSPPPLVTSNIPTTTPTTTTKGLGAGIITGIAIGILVGIVLVIATIALIIFIVIKCGKSGNDDNSGYNDTTKLSSRNTSVAPKKQDQEQLNYADIEPGPMTGSKNSKKNTIPPPDSGSVLYSDLQHSEQLQYADLAVSSARSGPPKKPPKDRSKVEYSSVQHQ